MSFDATNDSHRKIFNRLRRARGQLDAVITAMESGAPCKDVVTQLSAVTSALDRAGFAIISTAMRDCIVEETDRAEDGSSRGSHDGMTPEELEKLFMSLA